uniref:uncharacterized protein LOC105351567 n=1 Tax=Fragaria vesca subsp. vesca TaxID=101020 RepID=UPI0005C8047F|nr:PREDICTED: uncharacterized protein LOC105351567 [Fragaria vesca subsp. vesca]
MSLFGSYWLLHADTINHPRQKLLHTTWKLNVPPKAITNIKWQPPPPTKLKVNFDGSVIPPSRAAVGFVVRQSDGLPIIATSQNLGHMDILLAEAVALRDGLQLLSHHTSQDLLVEGDSKLFIDALTGRTLVPWRIKRIVYDIITLSAQFHSVFFKHVWREANFLADNFAKLEHSITSPQLWVSSLPLSSTSAFHLDLFRGSCSRGFSL